MAASGGFFPSEMVNDPLASSSSDVLYGIGVDEEDDGDYDDDFEEDDDEEDVEFFGETEKGRRRGPRIKSCCKLQCHKTAFCKTVCNKSNCCKLLKKPKTYKRLHGCPRDIFSGKGDDNVHIG